MQTIYQLQKNYYNQGNTLDISSRVVKLKRFKEALISNEAALYTAIEKDLGKGSYETYMTELSLIYKEIETFIKLLDNGSLLRPMKNHKLLSKRMDGYYKSRGQILVIAPFNYPIQLSIIPMISSYAMGNVTMVKLSEYVPNVNEILESLVKQVFLSEEIFVVTGDALVNQELLSMSYDLIFFTGSTRVGKIVMEAASKHLTPVVLELGGKSPAIIMDDAELEKAVQKIVWGKVMNSGQTCIAPDYVLVPEHLKEEVIQRVIDEANRVTKGQLLPLVHQNHADRFIKYFEVLKNNVRYGGIVQGKSISFSVIDNANIPEEIFAPVLPIMTYQDENDLLIKLKAHDYPLTSYIFTSKPNQYRLFAQKLRTGSVMFNDVLIHVADANMPFGGIRTSGLGSYHGEASLSTFAHFMPIVEGRKGINPFLKMPFNSKYQKVKWLRKFF